MLQRALSDETKKFHRDRYRDFFRDQNFQDRDRYSQKIEKSLDTEKSRDEMSHSTFDERKNALKPIVGSIFPIKFIST